MSNICVCEYIGNWLTFYLDINIILLIFLNIMHIQSQPELNSLDPRISYSTGFIFHREIN